MKFVATALVVAALTVTVLAQTQGPHMPAGIPAPGIAPPAGITAPPQPATPDATATLHGRVVVAETGKPLYRARIRLRRMASGNVAVTREALTNRDGLYHFQDLPPGRYMIHGSRPGFIDMHAGQKSPSYAGGAQELTGGRIHQFDFALPRGSVIAGRLTDDLGEPLPGIQITPLRVQYSFNGAQLQPWYSALTSPTDDRGEFRIAALPPGTYVLAANSQNDGTGEGYATTYYPGTRLLNEARRFRIGVRDDVTASFSMIPTRQVRVTGRVRSSSGLPVESYQVLLRTQTRLGTKSGRIRDGAGTFEFDGVSPGTYMLEVSSGRPYDPTNREHREFASIPIQIGEDDVTGLLITTGLGTTISGRVVYEGTSPRSFMKRPPRVTTRVVEDGAYGARMPLNDTNGVISDDGTFTVSGVHGKVLFIVNFTPGWQLRAVMLDGVDITDVPYDARQGGTDKLEIFITDQSQELQGKVVDAFGRPPVEFVVLAFPRNLKEGAVPGRFIPNSSTYDTDGSFTLANLPPGDYFAAAFRTVHENARYDLEFQDSLKDRATPFVISPGQTVKLELTLIE